MHREELIQWSIRGRVYWESEGQMVHERPGRVGGVQNGLGSPLRNR